MSVPFYDMPFISVTPPNKACMNCGAVCRMMYEQWSDAAGIRKSKQLGLVDVDFIVEKRPDGSVLHGYRKHQCEEEVEEPEWDDTVRADQLKSFDDDSTYPDSEQE